MKKGLGILLESGWTLDDALDLTFAQIGLVAECIMTHKLGMIEMVVGPMLGMFGGGYSKKPKVSRKGDQRKPKNMAKNRDDRLLGQLAAAGIPVSRE